MANENDLIVLVCAMQRKRQSVSGFAQEDIPPWFETEPLESEKCLSAGPRLSLPMKAADLFMIEVKAVSRPLTACHSSHS